MTTTPDFNHHRISMKPKKPCLEKLKLTHTEEAIRTRLELGPEHNYLKDFIYGAVDGAVTTFAVVAGVAGAKLSIGIVIILGMSNLIGDGFSMAVASYLATRAERELLQKARKEEELQIESFPEGEREEIRQIYAAKGFKGDDLERAVAVITADKNLWVETMLQEELGMSLKNSSPVRAGFSTFIAFLIVGIIPLSAFFIQLLFPRFVFDPFLWSAIGTGIGFFVIGAFKSRFVHKKWIVTGLETFLIGGCAASLAYFIGMLFGNLSRT